MSYEHPMFPPKRDNPFRVIGGTDAIVTAPPAKRQRAPSPEPEERDGTGWRDRASVKRDIEAHMAARQNYARGVSWLVAAEAENLPAANVEAAREDLRKLHAEMVEAARSLVIVMPTDLKALCDLTMYLEKNFTSLPAEITVSGSFGGMPGIESLAYHLLRTMRISLRHVAKYGKYGGKDCDRD